MTDLSLNTGSGEVTLTQLIVQKGLSASSDYGNIVLSQVLAAIYDVSTSSGEVNLDGAMGSVKIHSDYGDVVVSHAQEAALDLSTSSGAIQFSGSLADTPQLFKTDYGDVRLVLPEESALTLDLRTDDGQITSDLPVTVQGRADESSWQGLLNGGGATLKASTASGNISLETLRP